MNEEIYKLLTSVTPREFNRWRTKNPDVNIDLSGADFSGKKLDEINLSDALLTKTNFSGAELVGANFAQANISDSDFSGIDGRLLWAQGAIASRCRFTKAKLNKARFHFAHLEGADFTGSNLSNATFRHSLLIDAIFKNAKTTNTEFLGVNVRDAAVDYEDLRGALLPKEYRKSRNMVSLGKLTLLIFNLIIFIAIALFFYDMRKEAVKIAGDPAKTISSFYFYCRGNVCFNSQQPKKALAFYQKAVKQKEEPIYYYRMAQVYDQMGDMKKADKYFKKFMKLRPDDKKSQQLKVELEERSKRMIKKMRL